MKKTQRLIIIFILLFSLFTGFIPNNTVRAVWVYPGTYFGVGNTNYTVTGATNFSQIIINATNITFNHYNFRLNQIPATAKVNVSINVISDAPLAAPSGTLVLDFNFTVASGAGKVWFNTTGFKPAHQYRYDFDLAGVYTYINTNASGGLAYSYTAASAAWHRYRIYDYGDSTPPAITINFAGNHGEKGGPYWLPSGEVTALSGANLNGYYTNDSYQAEDFVYINLTVTDTESGLPAANAVRLDWHSETLGTWVNTSYFTKVGAYYEYNKTGVAAGKYSFNIRVIDNSSNTRTIYWNKTQLGSTYTRRYVNLKQTPVAISYAPLYLYKTSQYVIASDGGKADRFPKDQGTNGGGNDTGYLRKTTPTSTVNNVWCGGYVGYWYDDNSCIIPLTLTNIYFHVWYSFTGGTPVFGWYKSRASLSNPTTDIFVTSRAQEKSSIYYNGATTNDTYSLETKRLSTTSTSFTDNDIYQFVMKFFGTNPSIISNRSFTSFLLFDIPDNATLGALDSDADGLTDIEELYHTYTNPFLIDTDNDGATDFVEHASGSDPNDYTDTFFPPGLPTVTTNAATLVEETTTTLNGILTDDGGEACSVRFNYGLTTAYGTNTSLQPGKITGNTFTANLIGLTPGTLYHYRAYAINSVGQDYGADVTFVTKPNEPTAYTITNTGNSTQTHTWTKGTGANNTVIRTANGTYPTTPQSNISLYNGTASTTINNSITSGLDPGIPYYYRMWSYTPWGTSHQFSDSYDQEVKLTQPYAPTNALLNRTTASNVNLTWTNGTGSERTIIVSAPTGFPATPNEAGSTIRYNGTLQYYNMTIIPGVTYYFTAFSYVDYAIPVMISCFSYNHTNFTNVTGGGFVINCYDETTYANLTFNVLITNKDGTDTYYKTGCTNPETINESLCPNGAGILILVSATGYNQRQYMTDIYPGIFYTLAAYLPAKYENTTTDCVLRSHTDSKTVTNPAVDTVINLTHPLDSIISVQIYNSSLYGTYGGWYLVPDDKYNLTVLNVTISNTVLDDNTTEAKVEYYYWYCGLTPSSFIYQLTVYNRYYQPLQNVKLDVKKYINTTGTFDVISTIMTDAAGQTDIFLIPGTLYFFTLSKTGFITNTSYWVPTNALFTHAFIMDYELANETEPVNPFDYIMFNANFSISNATLSIRVLDNHNLLTNATIYIYENTTLIYTVNLTSTPWHLNYTNTDSSPNITRHSYSIHLYVRHHVVFGYYNFTITINQISARHGLLLNLDIDLVALLGEPGGSYGHIGWVNIFILAIGLFFILSFGRYWSGISIIGFGLLIAIIEMMFGLPGLTPLQVLCFICFAIVYGILVELGKAKEGRVY